MTILRVELDSIQKWRNRQEYRPVNRARIPEMGIESVGDGENIKHVLRAAASVGTPIYALVQVFRGSTPCFREMALKSWLEKGEQPEGLRRARQEAA